MLPKTSKSRQRILLKTSKILPNWQNFAKSGHTDEPVGWVAGWRQKGN